MTVSIGFSTTRAVTSRLIRWITRSRFSHSYIRYTNRNLRAVMAIDADPRGIIEKPILRLHTDNSDWVELVPPTREKKNILNKSLHLVADTLGTKYDYLSMFGRIFVILGQFLRRKWKNPLSSKRKDVCVENCYRLVSQVEESLLEVNPEDETPESLYRRLVNLGWVEHDSLELQKSV